MREMRRNDDYRYEFTETNVRIVKYLGQKVDVVIPDKIDGYPVEVIGSNAFEGRQSIVSVIIPESVKIIEDDAFNGCTGIAKITIPESVTTIGETAFNNCANIVVTRLTKTATPTPAPTSAPITPTHTADSATIASMFKYSIKSNSVTIDKYIGTDKYVVIPERIENLPVTEIGENAFYFSFITDVIIPNSVTSIGYEAFSSCISLTSVTIGDSVTSIGKYAFYACYKLTSISIPSSVTSIGDYAFDCCSGLTCVTIPNSVTSIGDYAFANCSGLTNITVDRGNTKYYSAGNCIIDTSAKTLILGCKNSIIPMDLSIKSIGECAFCSCYGLTSITIPNSVTSIGSSAFESCYGLTSITIPNSVTSIGERAFCRCYGLTNITVDRGNTKYYSAGNCLIETSTGLLISGCNNSIIPMDLSIKSIGEYAFMDYSLTSITIPNSITSIGDYAFANCSKITNIEIPSSVTSIGDLTFHRCSGLTSITIPNSVKSIGDRAFEDCNNLTIYTSWGSYAVAYAKRKNIKCVII